MDIVAYYRRRKKGRKDYGLNPERQQRSIERFAEKRDARIAASFTEVEDGQMEQRPELEKAIARCRELGAMLVIGSGYRMKVNVKFLKRLRGVEFAVANGPTISTSTLGYLLDTAQGWATQQSELVRQGMTGIVCGSARPGHWNPRNEELRQRAQKKATKASIKARRERAMAAYAPVLPLMKKWKAQKGTSFADVAERLNEEGYVTTAGMPFTPQAVHRIMKDFG